jgi:hypothetical protein
MIGGHAAAAVNSVEAEPGGTTPGANASSVIPAGISTSDVLIHLKALGGELACKYQQARQSGKFVCEKNCALDYDRRKAR